MRVVLVWVVLAAGCWTSEPLVDGAFTREQWAVLQDEMLLRPAPDPCAVAGFTPQQGAQCCSAIALAAKLFDDPSLSQPIVVPDPPNVPTSCADCHAATRDWIDPRTPNNVSVTAQPTKFTAHNALGLYNLAHKLELAAGRDVFTWVGGFTTPGAVALEVAVPKAMKSDEATVDSVATTTYASLYALASDPGHTIQANLERAFTAYLATATFITTATPLDLYLQGDDSALSDSAKRGLAVFVGRGSCIECHSGYLFSDLQFHNTGVPQRGDHVALADTGRFAVTGDPADVGRFLTQPLREVARTGPYMHDGSLATLADVIAFYRAGGVADGYSGTKDARIVPLDLTDDDALDLEAFLNALTLKTAPGANACAQP